MAPPCRHPQSRQAWKQPSWPESAEGPRIWKQNSKLLYIPVSITFSINSINWGGGGAHTTIVTPSTPSVPPALGICTYKNISMENWKIPLLCNSWLKHNLECKCRKLHRRKTREICWHHFIRIEEAKVCLAQNRHLDILLQICTIPIKKKFH